MHYMNTNEVLKLALEALDNLMYWDNGKSDYDQARQAITALREALAKPDFWEGYVPEPVKPAPPPECQTEAEKTAYAFGWWKALESQRALDKMAENARKLGLDYEPAQQEPVGFAVMENPITPPAQRKPLTDERIFEIANEHQDWDRNLIRVRSFARAIEAAHGITGES
jgi:hypothetical protein